MAGDASKALQAGAWTRNWSRQGVRLTALAVLAAVTLLAFMTLGVEADWAFVLQHRGTKALTMLVVACALGMSTVVFQTVTHNTILTPAVMGLDALYLFLQAVLVLVLGSVGVVQLGLLPKYGLEIVLMVALSVGLMRWLFTGHASSLHLMLLVGMVMGILFRSMTSFAMRMIDPNEFATLQDRMFANFNTIHTQLLLPSLVVLALGTAFFWRRRHVLDVLALGRDAAVNLGVHYQRQVLQLLVVMCAMVAISTALVGPVTFFGLLVANMAYQWMGTRRHAWVLPAVVLWGCVLLLAGQVVLERVLGFNSALSVVVEFVGGLVFIYLLMRKGKQ
ncbi:iron chelate uptake ABC transporter family permease subunit [Comamonas aquatica]|jgi:iron complex transport system permease protein|uniref:Enterobactin ABC transporter permease n=1 Tax=Comamonas aquatica DA1877 TaxID=1457173 RepID=A0A014Q9T2_9BURK|nr:iron chelate uptake ABC transporter family permease subunit [Comamonas aquatica]EXU79957.1 enterobactin ABC transporter permease [Comamonas aquatica DA1877]MDH1378281.1 iron chelate uptake ABC transporter family permease subunit [Comamonas aquatica]MDH1638007.1 iron chelate uptake ABC transporter family permease subunit [Comamonas aquatica]MDH1767562.1 iron chelate uptake ABC transporter family permease subunit [Comamonas aquatica]MDH1814932.1 iron chelate uptake ABC transporter family perm